MEDVLDVYARPLNPKRPLVCMDEGAKQLLDDSRPPEPMQAAQGDRAAHPVREDYEYVREGMCSFFMLFAPLLCWRHVAVTQRRTAVDFALVIQYLVDVAFPEAEIIVLVLDNLNTHTAASLYEAFEPAEAKRLADKLEIHYTPKHGSWLNMAEIELSVLGRQCLDRRLPDVPKLAGEIAAWEQDRNAADMTVHWHFTTADARIKLKKLYPKILP
jgi:transposase